jgi:hypothetical protein
MVLPLLAALGIGASLFGSANAANAAGEAAHIQKVTAKENRKLSEQYTTSSLADLQHSLDQATGQFTQAKTDAATNLSPFQQAGEKSLSQIMGLLGLNGPEASSAALSSFNASPDYQFRVGEGVKALDRSAAARGGLYSGAQGRALVDYGQQAGSQEFGNYYNRLSDVAANGQNAATTLSNINTNTAGAQANAYLNTGANMAQTRLGGLNAVTNANSQTGAAQAGGVVNAANAWTSGLNNISQIVGYKGGLSGATA